ncbi:MULTISPECIES: hypothetical protein [unclassified Enterococcus]|uniref:Y-family DNA polymerase n=1 Tax=unclassified Enterococcus TaxID=2608891 RepID=UPI0015525D7F|nr:MULTISPECIES: hypothetical protein [unclassified Enterococcus]MBS7576484.1 hypothetical protein [Enterococcus sp. MMGLQ5-2]MBS7583716.1 hypothetical protein [Enterococcus sp. MMGLQ5-1]NPD11577.1 hypothetical protein [Enterococcus sp. MMGLQ5-1]NPD36321.1 hypothetical protein [Enterococcus sp. MMGLQ5-2]
MSNFDYAKEKVQDIFMIDVKSFYASCECVARGLDPLTTRLVVLSHAENTSRGGLVLAASPAAKKDFGVTNVMRGRDLPISKSFYKALSIAEAKKKPLPIYDEALKFYRVPPRMRYYVKENMKINDIFKEFTAPMDMHPYSIDETILDVSASLNYFYPENELSRYQKRDLLAREIQLKVYRKLGFYVTIGIGDNVILAKLAMDNEAKHNRTMRAQWTYADVEAKVWAIKPLTDFWSIGSRMSKRFEAMGILSIRDLANYDFHKLHQKFGIVGLEYYHHANGIDRTVVSHKYQPKVNSLSNNQILPKDYDDKEFLLILQEQAAQTISRVRKRGAKAASIHLYVGYARGQGERGFSRQLKIAPTNSTAVVIKATERLFKKFYNGHSKIRHIGISFGHLTYTDELQLDLFSDPLEQIKGERLDQAVDEIRLKYGFTSIFKAASLKDFGTSLSRANSVGGHAGGTDGMEMGKPSKHAD